jgi:hypothetical protein
MSSFKYTSSPLGLLSNPESIQYPGTGNEFNSIFSSYYKRGVKHKISGSNSNLKSPILNRNLSTRHNNDIYNISTQNIIESLSQHEALKLNYADFAYLKNLGVYPNNRLIIARRFPSPVGDDLFSEPIGTGNNPISTVIGYSEDNTNLKISVGEVWEAAEVSFKELLNDVGADFGFSEKLGKLGDILEKGVSTLPLPGASLLVQRKIMAALGLFGEGVSFDTETGEFIRTTKQKNGTDSIEVLRDIPTIPQGDPNLIKEAQRRKLIGEDRAGSGLTGTFTITLKTTYEQKFINGVDPSIVFMDILNNVLNMGTSTSKFYLGKQDDAGGRVKELINKITNDPFKLITEFLGAIITSFQEQLTALSNLITKPKDDDKGFVEKVVDVGKSVLGFGENTKDTPKENPNFAKNLIEETIGKTKNYVIDFIRAKYKIKLMGIVTALTGAPSTPWHVTVGNPLRPIFSSGDMLCKSVAIDFGPQLSFNDLPTYIDVTVTLSSARNLGLQEIFSKFNSGGIRTTSGKYTTTESESFWNFSEESIDSDTNQILTGDEATIPDLDTGFETNPNNTRVNEGEILPEDISQLQGINPVIITPGIGQSDIINPDPLSTDSIIQSPEDISTRLRIDESQLITGDTSKFIEGRELNPLIPNTGILAQLPINIPTNIPTNIPNIPTNIPNIPTNWLAGKTISSGVLSGYGVTPINWSIKNGQTNGMFDAIVDGKLIGSSRNINDLKKLIKSITEGNFNFDVDKKRGVLDNKKIPKFR